MSITLCHKDNRNKSQEKVKDKGNEVFRQPERAYFNEVEKKEKERKKGRKSFIKVKITLQQFLYEALDLKKILPFYKF